MRDLTAIIQSTDWIIISFIIRKDRDEGFKTIGEEEIKKFYFGQESLR